jgi:hypothetical protein
VDLHPVATRTDKLLNAATLAVSGPAYLVASVVAACGLAVGAVIVLAWERRQERPYRERPQH